MYNPPKYMTERVLANVLGEFDWPATFKMEEDLPDGISIRFEACELYFCEGFETEMTLVITAAGAGVGAVELGTLIVAVGSFDVPSIESQYIEPSLDSLRRNIRNLCKIVLFGLRSTLVGEFPWVPRYIEYMTKHSLEIAR
jgi:hypothetical protein